MHKNTLNYCPMKPSQTARLLCSSESGWHPWSRGRGDLRPALLNRTPCGNPRRIMEIDQGQRTIRAVISSCGRISPLFPFICLFR